MILKALEQHIERQFSGYFKESERTCGSEYISFKGNRSSHFSRINRKSAS